MAFAGGMTAGRFAGGRAADRFGSKSVLVAGGAAAAGAMTSGLLLNTPKAFLLAVAVIGMGLANVTPLAMDALGQLSSDQQAAAVARLTVAQQVGFFAGPPLIGAASDLVGLQKALMLVPLVGAAIVALSAPLRLGRYEALGEADDRVV